MIEIKCDTVTGIGSNMTKLVVYRKISLIQYLYSAKKLPRPFSTL